MNNVIQTLLSFSPEKRVSYNLYLWNIEIAGNMIRKHYCMSTFVNPGVINTILAYN